MKKKSNLCKKATYSGAKEDYIDFQQFSVEIDLGFTNSVDPNEELVRRKKEDEVTKQIQREEADFNKMMKRKKLDNEIIEALIKDKKQLVFTYDYDGLLLPVARLENSKMPAVQYDMKY